MDANFQIGTVTSDFSAVENSESVALKSILVDRESKPEFKKKVDLANLNKIKFGKNLNEQQKSRSVKLIKSKYKAFELHESDIGLTNLIEHKIDTGDNATIKQRQHRLPQALQGEVEKQIKELLDSDVFRKAKVLERRQC